VQYTRNMVTGASTALVAVILVDARNGVVEQTRRHAYITTILRVPHITVAVNKMDLVDWSQERYEEIALDLETLGLADLHVIPLSALQGDNVVDGSENMPWYDGPPLLEHLETIEPAFDRNLDAPRFPVQWVIRPMSTITTTIAVTRAAWPEASGVPATTSSCCRQGCAPASRLSRRPRRRSTRLSRRSR
jgi:bifunctional enzyme CysN/CysC